MAAAIVGQAAIVFFHLPAIGGRHRAVDDQRPRFPGLDFVELELSGLSGEAFILMPDLDDAHVVAGIAQAVHRGEGIIQRRSPTIGDPDDEPAPRSARKPAADPRGKIEASRIALATFQVAEEPQKPGPATPGRPSRPRKPIWRRAARC